MTQPKAGRKLNAIKPVFVKWETVGQVVEGEIVGMAYVDMKSGGAVPKYTVKSDDGSMYSFLAGVQVAELLHSIPKGTYVRITFKGVPQGERFNDFDVEAEEYTPLPANPFTGEIAE